MAQDATPMNDYNLLKESQSFLDSVIENIPNMIFVKDAQDLKFVRFNRAGEDLIGHTRDEMIGKNDYDFFPKEQADFFTANDRQVLARGVVQEIAEEPLSTKNGIRYLSTKKIPVFDKTGRPKYLLGISEDITEKKQAHEQAIKLMHEQAARSAAEKSAQHFAFLSEAMKILSSSSNYSETLLQFAKNIGDHLADWCSIEMIEPNCRTKNLVIYHRDRNKMRWMLSELCRLGLKNRTLVVIEKVLQSGEACILNDMTDDVLHELSHNEEHFEFLKQLKIQSMMIVPLKAFDKVLGVLTFILADSDRKYTDIELTIALDLARRTSSAIEKTRLYERAQEANRAKTTFLANMSHEMRTPLGAIIGFAELMMRTQPITNEQMDYAKVIYRNGVQLLKIVDEVLDISKVESDRLTIDREPFSLSQVIEDVVLIMRRKAEDKGLRLHIYGKENLPTTIYSDPTRLRQILINVIGNSIKFTATGSVDVMMTCTADKQDQEQLTLKFVVHDTGIGIGAKEAKELFQPFVQADSTISRKFGGTGLGLYLSKKLAQALDGDVVLEESTTNLGSTFVITIRALRADNIKTNADEKTAQQAIMCPIDRCKVLVVDDSPDMRFLVSKLVANLGYSVEVAENGGEAISKAHSQKYDLILLDLQMPEMDGFETLAHLRRTGYSHPICALTAHAMKGDRERCLDGGFDNYLAKPITTSSLREVLQSYTGVTH